MELKDLSSNWKKLQASLKSSNPQLEKTPTKQHGVKRKRDVLSAAPVSDRDLTKISKPLRMKGMASTSSDNLNADTAVASKPLAQKRSYAADRINEGRCPV